MNFATHSEFSPVLTLSEQRRKRQNIRTQYMVAHPLMTSGDWVTCRPSAMKISERRRQ